MYVFERQTRKMVELSRDCLRRSNEYDPQDLQTVFGLAFALNRRHRAGPEAFPCGPGGGGTRGTAQSGQEGALEDCGPRAQGQGAEDGCGLLLAGCHAALPREVAARDHLLDWHAGAARAGHQRLQGVSYARLGLVELVKS